MIVVGCVWCMVDARGMNSDCIITQVTYETTKGIRSASSVDGDGWEFTFGSPNVITVKLDVNQPVSVISQLYSGTKKGKFMTRMGTAIWDLMAKQHQPSKGLCI